MSTGKERRIDGPTSVATIGLRNSWTSIGLGRAISTSVELLRSTAAGLAGDTSLHAPGATPARVPRVEARASRIHL